MLRISPGGECVPRIFFVFYSLYFCSVLLWCMIPHIDSNNLHRDYNIPHRCYNILCSSFNIPHRCRNSLHSAHVFKKQDRRRRVCCNGKWRCVFYVLWTHAFFFILFFSCNNLLLTKHNNIRIINTASSTIAISFSQYLNRFVWRKEW